MNLHFRPSRTKRAARRALAAAVAGLVATLAQAGTGAGDPADANISFVGRWDKSNGALYKSYWVGAYLTTKFTGRTLKLNLNGPAMTFIANIDGKQTTHWVPAGASQTDLTPTALGSSGTHTLQIINKYNEGEFGFVGLQLEAGATTLPADARPLVEFVGDSITAGHGTTDWAATDYAWQTGERLGVQHTQIAFSGITLADYHYYAGNPVPGMESAYFKTMAISRCASVECPNNPPWNFANYTARAVVVNLGTNDQNLGSNSTTPAEFQRKYTDFLANIRAKYPNADIFALRTFNGYYKDETVAAVKARLAAGDSKVHYIETEGWLQPGPPDFNDGFHPSDSGHIKVTNRLLPLLLPYVGVATQNDSKFSYDASWAYGWQNGTFQSDNHWSNVTNASYQVPFNGTQIKLYGSVAPQHGIAAVSVDGGPETLVDTYAPARADGVMLWSSPQLAAGAHSMKVRVTGTKNASSTNLYVTADRADVANGGLNLLSNPGFEDAAGGLNGWSTVTAGASQAVNDASQPNSGAQHLKHWSASPYWAATLQKLSGLANGLYTVRAWVRGSGGDQKMYVKNTGGGDKWVALPASNAYVQVVIADVSVTNGNAEVGFWTNDPWGNGWLNVDDVTFYKQ